MISKAQPRLLPYPDGPVPAAPTDAAARYTPLQVAWRRRWTVLMTVVIGLAAAFVYVMKATPVYTSSSRIYVEQTGPQILGDANGMVAAKQPDSCLQTYASMLKPTPIFSSAV